MSALLVALLLQAAEPPPSPPAPQPPAPEPAAAQTAPDPEALAPENPAPAVPASGSDTPVPLSDDSPEEIARDSARDLKDSRYYNKPGATRADYDRDWQECRLIARGSVTPGGSPIVVYNPAIMSPAAAAGAGLLGGLIAGAIADGETRRANRRACLLYRGWRQIEVTDKQEQAFVTMSDSMREAWFNRMVGADNPEAKSVLAWTNNFAVAPPLAPAPPPKN